MKESFKLENRILMPNYVTKNPYLVESYDDNIQQFFDQTKVNKYFFDVSQKSGYFTKRGSKPLSSKFPACRKSSTADTLSISRPLNRKA